MLYRSSGGYVYRREVWITVAVSVLPPSEAEKAHRVANPAGGTSPNPSKTHFLPRPRSSAGVRRPHLGRKVPKQRFLRTDVLPCFCSAVVEVHGQVKLYGRGFIFRVVVIWGGSNLWMFVAVATSNAGAQTTTVKLSPAWLLRRR